MLKLVKLFIILIICSLLGSVFLGGLALGETSATVPDFSSVTANPYPLIPYAGNPVLKASIVTDRTASFVADPFLFYDNNLLYMFFEAGTGPNRTEIAFATRQ